MPIGRPASAPLQKRQRPPASAAETQTPSRSAGTWNRADPASARIPRTTTPPPPETSPILPAPPPALSATPAAPPVPARPPVYWSICQRDDEHCNSPLAAQAAQRHPRRENA